MSTAAVVTAAPPSEDLPNKPPEDSRLSTAVFRAGLKKRGLTELLELHLKDFPPAGKTEALNMMREVKLAIFADETRPDSERRTAAAQANRILERLIDENSADPRRFEWRFDLAHSLLYDEAEPFLTRIFYRGGNALDRKELLSRSTRAVDTLRVLATELAEEYERVDRMSIREFEKLEDQGYVERLDALAPRTEYLLLWALLYDALPRDDADPTRARELNEIIERITGHPALLGTPHDTSHVQVQALLLAGIAHRLLNNHQPAREHLDRAIAVAQRLGDPAERERVDWAVTLAWLESVRNETDDGRFDEALSRLTRFRELTAGGHGGDYGLRVVAALLERSVYRLRGQAADQAGHPSEAARFREESWRALAQLAQAEPDHRDEVYAALYEMMGPEADVTRLDPFEQCALVAGLLSDADRSDGRADLLLDRAVTVGERFISTVKLDSSVPGAPVMRWDFAGGAQLVPEVIYNIAVAQYRRGYTAAAATRFIEVARDHPTFSKSLPAARYAVQLAAELYGDPSLRLRPDVQRLYRDGLELLMARHPHSDAARYWRFYYAQLLDELGDYAAAAAQYALVDQGHEHYLQGLFYRVRCLALGLQQRTDEDSSDLPTHRRRTDGFFAAQREFVALATGELGRDPDEEAAVTLRSLLARAQLLAAEVHVLPHSGRAVQALETLAGFEDEYPDEKALGGRVWRVRLVAYQELGRLDEATRAIPAYIAADPRDGGATLQSLYQALADDVREVQARGDIRSAQQKADMALILARQIHDWASRPDSASTAADRRALTVQLAEANLCAGRFERARELFASLLPAKDGPTASEPPGDVRVLLGHAEALFQLEQFAKALPQFNRLATGLPATDPIRWRALLRDLQCRTSSNHPPEGIVKVIRQQKRLYPELGGPVVARQLEKLQRENQRRLDDGSQH